MVQTEVLNVNGASGDVAKRLIANNMNIHALRPWIGADGRCYMNVNEGGTLKPVVINAATLRRLEWEQYDQAIVQEVTCRLVGVADLVSRGLVYNISNGLGKTVLTSENINQYLTAEISMDGLSATPNDRAQYGQEYLPLPIIHADYRINARELAASRNTGDALDTTNAQMAARAVAEKLETMLFVGASSFTFGAGTIYGYLDFPYKNTSSLTGNWDASGIDGEDIVNDVLAMKQALIGDFFYGPYALYVPTAYETVLDKDFSVSGGNNQSLTIRERILKINNIVSVKVVDKLTANHVVLVQLTSDVVRLVSGMEIAPIEWQENGGLVLQYKVMGIKVPQIRATQATRCGICVGS